MILSVTMQRNFVSKIFGVVSGEVVVVVTVYIDLLREMPRHISTKTPKQDHQTRPLDKTTRQDHQTLPFSLPLYYTTLSSYEKQLFSKKKAGAQGHIYNLFLRFFRQVLAVGFSSRFQQYVLYNVLTVGFSSRFYLVVLCQWRCARGFSQ